MARLGFVLSGCGFQDGSEIQEAVIAMMTLEENAAELVFLAPDQVQRKVVDHVTGESQALSRNILVEASRITRGKIQPLASVAADELDGVVLPGGFGAALNLCDFALQGAAMTVDQDLTRLLLGLHADRKPIGAICIAPVILAKIFGDKRPRLTIGSDRETASAIEQMGAQHIDCRVEEIVVDATNLFVTTPAYMLAKGPGELHRGIRKWSEEITKMCTR